MANVTWNTLKQRRNIGEGRTPVRVKAYGYKSTLTAVLENEGVILSVWECDGPRHISLFLTYAEAHLLSIDLDKAMRA